MSLVETFQPVPPTAAGNTDLSLFHRLLAQLCRADVPLPKALRLLARELERPRYRDAAVRMADEVEAGATLADAYGSQHELPDLYRALIAAGQQGGDLPGILDEIARHAADREQIRARMRQALFHPLLTGIGVLAIAIGLFAFADPLFGPYTAATSQSLGASDGSVWRLAPWLLLLLTGAAVAAGLWFAWRRSPLDGSNGPRGFAFRLPFAGYLRACAAKSGFASTLGLLIQRGLPLPQALALAAAATDEPSVRAQVEAMGRRAEDGGNLSESVEVGGLLSPAMQWFVESAEQSNTPALGLLDVARIYQKRLERATDRLCALAGPVALLAIGLLVLTFVLATFGPIYSGFVGIFRL